MDSSSRKLISSFLGVLIMVLVLVPFIMARPVTINDINSGKVKTISVAEKDFLQIQKEDAEELKSFLANPVNYAILSTSDPQSALRLLQNSRISERRLAGSVMVPIDNPEKEGRLFKRIYKIYLILKTN